MDYKQRDLQPSSGYLIDLGELGDNELHQAYDMDADSVYEFDLDDDTMQKFNAKNRIGIVRHNAKEKILLLERKPNKRKLVLMRSSYQIHKQIDAVYEIIQHLLPEHAGLLKLFAGVREWPTVDGQDVQAPDWKAVTGNNRTSGTCGLGI